MPQTRRSAQLESQPVDNGPAAASKRNRTALGDVSNRRATRSSARKGRTRATTNNNNPAAATRRTSARTRNSTANETTTVLEDIASATEEAPKRRRSLRSCVVAQRVKADESARSSSQSSNKQSSKSGRKASQPAPARGRKAKRPHEEPDELQQTRKKPRRSTSSSNRKASTAKKASKPRARSTSRKKSSSKSVRRSSRSPSPRKPCSVFLTETNYGLARVPFDSSKFTLGVSPYDQANKNDVLEVSNYTTDLFQRLYFAEEQARPGLYMDDQDEITPAMRSILVDWLVEVHMKFRLVPATLYLCVNIIDRYCSRIPVERRKLQLVGVTALLVACKYEEIYPPEVRDCVYITDRTYTRQEVLDMEQEIVRQLEFKMTVPTAHPFLTRFLLITKASKLAGIAASYYLERTLQEYHFLKYRPSLVAASAVCLALNNPDIRLDDGATGPSPGVPRVLLEYTGFRASDITQCAAEISVKVGGVDEVAHNRRHLVAVRRKYDSRKYQHISTEFEDPDVEHLLN